jgi:hypothetical protein
MSARNGGSCPTIARAFDDSLADGVSSVARALSFALRVDLWSNARARRDRDPEIRYMRHDSTDAVTVMSLLLALGAEKMLKLTLGLASRDHGNGCRQRTTCARRSGTAYSKPITSLDRCSTACRHRAGALADLKGQVNADRMSPETTVLERGAPHH